MLYPSSLPCPSTRDHEYTIERATLYLGDVAGEPRTKVKVRVRAENNAELTDFFYFYDNYISYGKDSFQWALPIDGVTDYEWTVKIISDVDTKAVGMTAHDISFTLEIQDDVQAVLDTYTVPAGTNMPCPVVDSYQYAVRQQIRYLGGQYANDAMKVQVTMTALSTDELLKWSKFFRTDIRGGVDYFNIVLPIKGEQDTAWSARMAGDVKVSLLGGELYNITYTLEILEALESGLWVDETLTVWVDENTEIWTKE